MEKTERQQQTIKFMVCKIPYRMINTAAYKYFQIISFLLNWWHKIMLVRDNACPRPANQQLKRQTTKNHEKLQKRIIVWIII